jgi:hypothetical protein
MPKPWREVAASPEYQALPPDQQNAAREQYFSQVVAPQISDPSQVQAAKAQFDAQTAPAPPAASDPTEGMSTLDKLRAGMGKAFVDTARGIRQLGDAVSDPFGIQHATNPGAVAQTESLKEDQALADQRDKALMATKAGLAGDIGGHIAMLAAPGGALKGVSALRGVAVSPALESALVPTTARAIATQGAALGAAQPLVTGQSGIERAGNAALGGSLGILGQSVGRLIGSGGQAVKDAAVGIASRLMPQADAASSRLAQVAAQHGIDLTAPQVVPSRFAKVLDSVSGAVPFSGAGKVAAQQQGQFNRAVSRTIGEDTDAITPDVYAAAKQRIGDVFNDVTSRNDLPIDSPLIGKLMAIASQAKSAGDDATGRAVQNAIGRVIDQSQNSVLPGRAYQSLNTELGNIIKGGGEKGYYVGQVRNALRDAMDNAIAPADKAAWDQARTQYRNLKTIRDLVAKGDSAGNINPSLLMGRVTANGASKEAMATGGGGDLGDLAQIGQRFLKNSVANSGTPERLVATGLLGGSYFTNPVAPVAGVVSARAVQNILQSPQLLNAVLRNPQTAPALRVALERELGRLGGQAGQQISLARRDASVAQP